MPFNDYLQLLLAITTSFFFAAGLKAPNPILKTKEADRAKLKGFLENTEASGQHMCLGLIALSAYLGLCETIAFFTKNNPGTSSTGTLLNSLVLFPNGDLLRMHLTPTHILGSILVIIGGSIRLWSFKALGKWFTFQVAIQKNQKLVTHGLYSIVRHPSYSAILFTHTGIAMWHFTEGSWVRESGVLNTTIGWLMAWGVEVLLVVVAYMIIVNRPPQEDEVMRKAFGKEWEDWAKAVPYRIVPGIF